MCNSFYNVFHYLHVIHQLTFYKQKQISIYVTCRQILLTYFLDDCQFNCIKSPSKNSIYVHKSTIHYNIMHVHIS